MDQLISYATLTFAALFPIANPIGVIPAFYQFTADNSPGRRYRYARQIAVNVILVLAIFLVSGRLILNFFGLSLGVLQMTGGLLVAHTAWSMVSLPSRPTEKETLDPERDFTLIPMAFPIISGPGSIGMVIGLIAKDPQLTHYLGSLVGIVGIGTLVYFCLSLGEPLIKILGKNGVDAFTRILGFFILAIAIQLMVNGLFSVLKDLPLNELITISARA
jgi:multiple antibiotic resistance protein